MMFRSIKIQEEGSYSPPPDILKLVQVILSKLAVKTASLAQKSITLPWQPEKLFQIE
jgi:hypothetical protein